VLEIKKKNLNNQKGLHICEWLNDDSDKFKPYSLPTTSNTAKAASMTSVPIPSPGSVVILKVLISINLKFYKFSGRS